MPIVVTYLTAFADSAGHVEFRPDAYGWDATGRVFNEIAQRNVGGAAGKVRCPS